MQFFKESNGRQLTITVNVENLLQKIDELRTDEDYMEYACDRVGGNCETDKVGPESIMNDLDEFAKLISYYGENGNELFDKVAYKKNGTFSLRTKHVLKQAVNGSYWEDHYGWNTKVLRIEPVDDTHAEVVLANIIVHY